MEYPFLREPYQWEGIQVLPLSGKNRSFYRPLTLYRTLSAFRQLPPPQILHSLWLTEATLAGQFLSRLHQIPQIATVMGQDAQPQNRYLKLLTLSSMKVVPLSHRSAQTLWESTGHRVADVIPIGLSETGGQSERSLDLLTVGSLLPIKRQDRFVELVDCLRKDFPDLKAAIIGTGPQRQKLQEQIQKLRLERNLQLWGELPREEVLQWMGRTRVFVFTSENEGMGYVLLEALAQGAHLVSTPVGIAETGPKSRVASTDSELADAARQFLRNPVDTAPRLPFSLDDSVQNYLKLYEEILRKPSGS
jgi:glycosyltransferase involved in cell wall biosynthesis